MAQHSNDRQSRVWSNRWVYALLWAMTFVLYLPAIRAGWVIDAAGWLAHVKDKSEGLIPYLNRSGSTIPGLYQFTQLITLFFYRIWGANVYVWSLLYQTIHALNAWLFFLIAAQVLGDSGYELYKARRIALTAALLFTICPHISEALIWKACYHYLQGFLMSMLCVYCFIAYLHTPKMRYVWISGFIFLCSVFSLELFYLTPIFLVILTIYYSRLPLMAKGSTRKVWLRFVLPQVAIMGGYVWLFRRMYPGAKPHVYNLVSQSFTEYFSKGPKYVFHILFFGRYFPYPLRLSVYTFTESVAGMVLCYGLFALLVWKVGCRISSGQPYYRVALLLISLAGVSIALLFPLAFPRDPLLVFYDRYTYVAVPFVYLLLTVLLARSSKRILATFALLVFGGVNLYFTVKLNLLWKHSNFVVQRLLKEFPDAGNRTVLLLNVPDNMNGVAMIGANPDGAFKSLRGALLNIKAPAPVYDVLSYNLTGLHDAGKVIVKNDSTLYVAFNQIGNWWTYDGLGAHSYSNSEYSVALRRRRNDYILTLKHPRAHYLILNEVDGNWMPVKWEMGRRDYFDEREFDVHQYDEWKLRDGERISVK